MGRGVELGRCIVWSRGGFRVNPGVDAGVDSGGIQWDPGRIQGASGGIWFRHQEIGSVKSNNDTFVCLSDQLNGGGG